MLLKRSAREFYHVALTATTEAGDPVAADDWEASFDGGTTWFPAEAHTHDDGDGDVTYSSWLVAGPDVAQGGAVAVITGSLVPQMRLNDNPESVVRDGPRISLV